MLLNGKANDQAGQHCEAALQACTAQNQLSSEQKKCSPCVAAGAGGFGGGFGGGGGYGGGDFASIVSTNWDDNGACKPTAAQPCTDLNKLPGSTGLGKLPTNCKDKSGKAISCLASGLAAFKQNPDGSVTVKGPNGNKTYSSADFVDKKSMMAAGMSAAEADKLVNELYGKNSALAKAGVDAKNLATDASKDKKYSDSFGNTSTVNLNSVSDANKKFGEKLGDLADRRPSSEGLARDYKGDLIGASGDDIFNMMQRRYKLKNQQDSFIAP